MPYWDDTLNFIVGLVNALAWPATIIFLAALILNNLEKIASVIESIKVSGVEINLIKQKIEKITEDIATETEKIVEANADKGGSAAPMDPELIELAEKSPALAIIESWNSLERAIKKAYQSNFKDGALYKNASAQAQALFSAGDISETTRNAIIELNQIRNKIVHHNVSGVITKEIAYTYLSAEAAISRYLGRI